MNSNFRLFFGIMAAGALVFSGCSSEDEPIENIAVVEEGNVKPSQKVENNTPTAILGSGGSMSSALSETFTKIVDAAQARHVIVAFSDLDAYKDDLTLAYQKGAVITVIDPEVSKLDAWCDANGMIYAGDPTAANDYALVSFNKKASSISIQKRKKTEEIEEEEVPLVIFTGWLDKLLQPNHLSGSDFKSRDLKKRFTPQHVSQVFPIDLSKEEIQSWKWGLPETASLSTTAELNCDIYPIHSFADNSFTGDIYAIEAELIIHNGNLYNGRWQYTQGKSLYEVCGFYLNRFTFGAELFKKEAGQLVGTYAPILGGAAPTSTDASAAYQSGFDWSFDGWITGGNGLESPTPTPLQQGGWTWSNLQENAPGLNISVESSIWPVWTVEVDGCPTTKEDALPEMATGDLTFRCSWIWGVPEATDDSTERYYMCPSFSDLSYGWHRSSGTSSKIAIEYLSPNTMPGVFFMIIPPSRAEGQRVNM